MSQSGPPASPPLQGRCVAPAATVFNADRRAALASERAPGHRETSTADAHDPSATSRAGALLVEYFEAELAFTVRQRISIEEVCHDKLTYHDRMLAFLETQEQLMFAFTQAKIQRALNQLDHVKRESQSSYVQGDVAAATVNAHRLAEVKSKLKRTGRDRSKHANAAQSIVSQHMEMRGRVKTQAEQMLAINTAKIDRVSDTLRRLARPASVTVNAQLVESMRAAAVAKTQMIDEAETDLQTIVQQLRSCEETCARKCNQHEMEIDRIKRRASLKTAANEAARTSVTTELCAGSSDVDAKEATVVTERINRIEFLRSEYQYLLQRHFDDDEVTKKGIAYHEGVIREVKTQAKIAKNIANAERDRIVDTLHHLSAQREMQTRIQNAVSAISTLAQRK